MRDNARQLVDRLQAEMRESGKEVLDNRDWENLRATIRITVEFQEYLKHGNTEIARGIYESPATAVVKKIDPDHADRFEEASKDPFNRYDLQYACETCISGVDCFAGLSPLTRVMTVELKSRIDWGCLTSLDAFKLQFFELFDEFVAEPGFERKLRLLLDLFKLQLVFVGISY
jgi:hypothetical protein